MKAHKWATILLEENKTLMSTRRQHTRAHTHNKKKRNNRIKGKNVPMVLKMLYNWDDMHIFAFAFPKKPPAGSSHTLFFFKVKQNRCWNSTQHLWTFIHYPLDSHSRTRQAVPPLAVCQTAGLEASMQTRHKPCSDCIYNIFIYKQIYGGEGRGGGRWRKQNKNKMI